LRKAKDAFDEKNYKWSIVMAYYSIFHAARSILFALGLKEKRHSEKFIRRMKAFKQF